MPIYPPPPSPGSLEAWCGPWVWNIGINVSSLIFKLVYYYLKGIAKQFAWFNVSNFSESYNQINDLERKRSLDQTMCMSCMSSVPSLKYLSFQFRNYLEKLYDRMTQWVSDNWIALFIKKNGMGWGRWIGIGSNNQK